jgi:hypothetical protein
MKIDTWLNALGTWRCDEIRKANLWIWVVAPSSELGVNNAENRRLQDRILNFWMSLLLHETADVQTAWVLSGSLFNGEPDIRSMQSYPRILRHSLRRPGKTTVAQLRSIATIGEVLENSYKDKRIYGRFDRGLTAFISGKQSEHIDESILCYVRALEGILHPADRNQFCRRAAKLIRSDQEGLITSHDLLASIYDARSGFTHAEALTTVFPGLSERDAVLRGRELQAATYHLASRCYVAALSDPRLVGLFSSESIGGYWGQVVVGKKRPPFMVELNAREYTFEYHERGEETVDG